MSGRKIIEGAIQALDWTRGLGKQTVHLPDGSRAEMTIDEYIAWRRAWLSTCVSDESPKGEDPKGLSPKDDSATGEAGTPVLSSGGKE